MSKVIAYTKKLIEKQVKENCYSTISDEFGKYQKAFYWTNENINYYLNLIDCNKAENALTVASSGDHIYNLVSKNILNVDSFDINALTEYYALGLKKAMILKYDYYKFILMMDIIASSKLSVEALTYIINDLLPLMDEKYRKFWNEIINFNYKIQKKYGTNLNLMQMLYFGINLSKYNSVKNCYLQDEYTYNEFKNKLIKANLSFSHVDAFNLPKYFKGKKFDIILLSNILDYAKKEWGISWNIETLNNYLKNIETITNDDAIVFYKYILSFIREGVEKDSLFYDSAIKKSEIEDKIYEIPKPSNIKNIDGVILRRVKIDK